MNITDILLPNEEIIYEEKANRDKFKPDILGLIVILIICLIIFGVMILGLFVSKPDLFTVIILFSTIMFFILIIGKNLFDEIFLKAKRIEGQIYYVTNKRVIVYSTKSNTYRIGYLNNFNQFTTDSGDVMMAKGMKNEDYHKLNFIKLMTILFKGIFAKEKNIENASSIVFEATQNPKQVLELIKNQKKQLSNNQIMEDVFE